MIKDTALDMVRDVLYGDYDSDNEINYFALFDSGDSEVFRAEIVNRSKGTTGVLDTVFEVLDSDGEMEIRKIRFYAGATATPESGTLIASADYEQDKTELESIEFYRKDTIRRAG